MYSYSPNLVTSARTLRFHILGIEYNVARIPIASCDFSTRNYSYDDVANDFELEHFELANEDLTKKEIIL